MFHSLNLSKSLVSDISKILKENEESHDLPVCLLEHAKKVSTEYADFVSMEQRHDFLIKNFMECVENNKIDYDTSMLLKFEQAVDHFHNRK